MWTLELKDISKLPSASVKPTMNQGEKGKFEFNRSTDNLSFS